MFQSYGRTYSQAVAQAAQTDANGAQASAREAKTEVELLRNDVGRLSLITEALWTFLKKQHGYSDEDLSALVQEIDLRDGRLDGKTAKASPSACPKCGRKNSNKYSTCIYCGSPLPVQLFAV
jgi:predicted phage gp36 major capsid-like protein